MRGLVLSGRDRWFQRGRFFAAAPWHIFQATPQAQQKVVPVLGAVLGRVEEMAKKEIPAEKTYKLSWASPRRAGGTVRVRFSCGHQNGPLPRLSIRLIAPSLRKNVVDSLKTDVLAKPRGRTASYCRWSFETDSEKSSSREAKCAQN
jgi:hypothetical protein